MRQLRIFLPLTIAFALATGCNKDEVAEDKPVLRPVRVEAVQLRGGERQQTLVGVARAAKEMGLSFRVGGTISAIKVKVGDKIKAGQTIAELDGRDARIEVARARASLAQAEAQARAAVADYDRLKLLYESNNASRADLDSARAATDSAKATVNAEKSAVQLAGLKSADHVLRCRAAGEVAAIPREVDENVQAGETVVLINAGEKVEVEVAVPESLVSDLKTGARATARFKTIPGEEFAGVVSEIGVASNDGDTTFPMRVRLDGDAAAKVRPGMAGTVTVRFGSPGEAPSVYIRPIAVQKDSEGTHVMVAKPTDGDQATVTRTAVDVGKISPGMGMLVKKGLADGDRVIIAGVSQISDGMTVRLLPDDLPKHAGNRLARGARPTASAAPPPEATPKKPEPKK